MALGGNAIASVRNQLASMGTNKKTIASSIETVEYVKNNNDLTMWADDTAIGSKWSENVQKLINTSNNEVMTTIDDLIKQTEQFLSEQEQANTSGQ